MSWTTYLRWLLVQWSALGWAVWSWPGLAGLLGAAEEVSSP
jgi:hypothetical protein